MAGTPRSASAGEELHNNRCQGLTLCHKHACAERWVCGRKTPVGLAVVQGRGDGGWPCSDGLGVEKGADLGKGLVPTDGLSTDLDVEGGGKGDQE